MQVAKWRNSLAVRLPSAVVEALDHKAGDQIEIRIAGEREFEVSRDRSKAQALARLRKLRRPLPSGLTFSGEEANERLRRFSIGNDRGAVDQSKCEPVNPHASRRRLA